MLSRPHLPVLAVLLAAGLATLSVGAQAQSLRARSSDSVAAGPTRDRNSQPTSETTGLPSINAQQSTTTGTGAPSRYSVLGLPLRFAAPVTPSYNEAGRYTTFAGQPMTGKEAVLQQSIDGSP